MVLCLGGSNNHKNTKTNVFKSQSIISRRFLYLFEKQKKKWAEKGRMQFAVMVKRELADVRLLLWYKLKRIPCRNE